MTRNLVEQTFEKDPGDQVSLCGKAAVQLRSEMTEPYMVNGPAVSLDLGPYFMYK